MRPLPRPISSYALAVYKERLYLFGGKDDRGYANATYIYSRENDWSSHTIAAGIMRDEIYDYVVSKL